MEFFKNDIEEFTESPGESNSGHGTGDNAQLCQREEREVH